VIKPEFDDTLKDLMEKLAEVRDGLDEEHKSVARALNMDPEGKVLHFEQHSLYGYCFRLTRKVRTLALFHVLILRPRSQEPVLTHLTHLYAQEATAIKNKKAYIELKSQTNGVHFTTKDLKALNDDYKDVTKDYEKKQSSLVKEVIQIAG
jgi:DNA mismatch repair protein MSH2